jgi:hypothetical protein
MTFIATMSNESCKPTVSFIDIVLSYCVRTILVLESTCLFCTELVIYFNLLPVQFKSLLHGQEGCVFFSGHLNLCTCQYVWVHLARQATFKSSTFWYVRAGKGLNIDIMIVYFSSFSYLISCCFMLFYVIQIL